jgi:hypothetical protein
MRPWGLRYRILDLWDAYSVLAEDLCSFRLYPCSSRCFLGIFFVVTGAVAGKKSTERAWDEGTEHDSNRAYRFGFTVACVVYLVFWLLLTRGWVPVEAAFPAMGAFTGGSYCLFMGITGLKGWYETRNTPD